MSLITQGTNAPPTSGQANPYTLFQYDLNGRVTRRERKVTSVIRTYDFFWDGDDRLRLAKEGALTRLQANYDGDGLRVYKWDAWTAGHDFTWGPGGVLHDSDNNTAYTPGFSQRKNGTDSFYHSDWLGSTQYTSDSSGSSFPTGLRFDAFGMRTATAGTYHPTTCRCARGRECTEERGKKTAPGANPRRPVSGE